MSASAVNDTRGRITAATEGFCDGNGSEWIERDRMDLGGEQFENVEVVRQIQLWTTEEFHQAASIDDSCREEEYKDAEVFEQNRIQLGSGAVVLD